MKSLVLTFLLASLFVGAPAEAEDEPVVSVTAPVVAGTASYARTLTATTGSWDPADVTTTLQWLRDGATVPGATAPTYRLRVADIGHRLSVLVTAVKDGRTGQASSAPTAVVRPASFTSRERPSYTGVRRFGRTLVARPGRYSPRPAELRFRWLRDGEPVKGATRRRYRLGVEDVGAKLRLRVTLERRGYRTSRVHSRQALVKHRVDVRRRVTYSVVTRGRVTASVREFARLAQQTLDDPRGWRGAGISFRRVRSGGSFTLVLSQASHLPSFGYPCDSMWSCRSGRFVIINQDRWLHASPMWNRIGRSLRDYRHMVVNHETGHWLGRGHRQCGGKGKKAPVMQQQSKGLDGCRANPWPLRSER